MSKIGVRNADDFGTGIENHVHGKRHTSRPFSHPVACCCMLLRGVGSCCAKFETGQTFSHVPDATTPNIVGQQCWELLRPFARSLKVILNLSNSIFPPRVIFLILPADGNFDAF